MTAWNLAEEEAQAAVAAAAAEHVRAGNNLHVLLAVWFPQNQLLLVWLVVLLLVLGGCTQQSPSTV
jgi:hypothetical protein